VWNVNMSGSAYVWLGTAVSTRYGYDTVAIDDHLATFCYPGVNLALRAPDGLHVREISFATDLQVPLQLTSGGKLESVPLILIQL